MYCPSDLVLVYCTMSYPSVSAVFSSKASPSMRDAIQGMLSMSQLPASTLQTSVGSSPFLLDRDKCKASLRLERESKSRRFLYEEGGEYKKGERLPTVFRDEDYGEQRRPGKNYSFFCYKI